MMHLTPGQNNTSQVMLLLLNGCLWYILLELLASPIIRGSRCSHCLQYGKYNNNSPLIRHLWKLWTLILTMNILVRVLRVVSYKGLKIPGNLSLPLILDISLQIFIILIAYSIVTVIVNEGHSSPLSLMIQHWNLSICLTSNTSRLTTNL